MLHLPVATTLVRPGDIIRADPASLTVTQPQPRADWQVSFDGGARHRYGTISINGPHAAGAGAALWGLCGPDWLRRAAVPAVTDSMTAEAVGLRCPMGIARLCLERPTSLQVLGDKLPIVRLAAGHGRLTMDSAWQIIETPLLHAGSHRWPCIWVAVRWCFNKLADRLATRRTHTAVAQRHADDLSARLWL